MPAVHMPAKQHVMSGGSTVWSGRMAACSAWALRPTKDLAQTLRKGRSLEGGAVTEASHPCLT